MDETLKLIFSLTNDWLKFAENKNAALIATNLVLVFGIISLIQDITFGSILIFYLYLSIISFLFGVIISMISFVPILKIKRKVLIQKSLNESDSLYFYENIAKYNPQLLLELINKRSYKKIKKFSHNNLDLANQIIINSQIALHKFILFKIAIFFTLLPFVTTVIASIIYFIKAQG